MLPLQPVPLCEFAALLDSLSMQALPGSPQPPRSPGNPAAVVTAAGVFAALLNAHLFSNRFSMLNLNTFTCGGRTLHYHSVEQAVARFGADPFATLPFAARVFAENILRRCPADQRDAALRLIVERRRDADFPFFPARVVLQDLTGTPALVDLAGLRDAVAESGGDARRVNPQVPVVFVVDHSLNVDVGGAHPGAMQANMAEERRRNAERFDFIAWCKAALSNVEIVMPGNGILHQINLERLSPVVQIEENGEGALAFPDTLIGTDSHTPMINALGVLGWGVGGIEAESVMLGRAIRLRLPEIVGVRLDGAPQPGITATDIVLAITEQMRAAGVVGAILEFHGPGAAALALPDRGTIANMAPEFGATAALFAIDPHTLDFLRLTGRSAAQIECVEAYAKAQGLWSGALDGVHYDRLLALDLASVERSIAGPSDPHQRISVSGLRAKGIAQAGTTIAPDGPLPERAIVIAAITSCTNTSNPRNMIAAGLLARNAVARGLARKPWVKTSLAPGSRAVESYLRAAGLAAPLEALGFGIVGYGCTSCNGMSGPLPDNIVAEIHARNIEAAAVLSGNRNFDGRIHPHVRHAFIASPPLVVAYAIAGSMRVDIERDPLGIDRSGNAVTLADLWPSDAEIDAALAAHVHPQQFTDTYDAMFQAPAASAARVAPPRFAWDAASTYIRRPPYWNASLNGRADFRRLRALAVLGDNITTDHMSPSGAILADSAAGKYLIAHGVPPNDFNSYGTRRGDHQVAVRATFANNRLRNEMTPGVEGSFTRLEPDKTVLPLFDAAEVYLERGQALIVVGGINYGAGSSRDWAAKGVRLLGVRAVVVESFERIHRSNLAGMGVLPLEFAPGITRTTLGLDGSELFSIEGLPDSPAAGMTLTLVIERNAEDPAPRRVPVTCRLETTEEVEYFKAGGLLPLMHREFTAALRP